MTELAMLTLVLALNLQPLPVAPQPTATETAYLASDLLRLELRSAPAHRAVVFVMPQTITRQESRVVCGMTILAPPQGVEFPMRRMPKVEGLRFPMRFLESGMCSDR